ncbi:hypothetical protein B296_00003161, partial [Ensete ventricosum]
SSKDLVIMEIHLSRHTVVTLLLLLTRFEPQLEIGDKSNSLMTFKASNKMFLKICSLETTLRNFSCLTTGDSIMVAYNNKKYYIDIVETKPSSAVSIIETDCEVDFAPPLDYKEPERPQTSAPMIKAPAQGFNAHYLLFFPS